MTRKYPKLTIENVRFWYWMRTPRMSGHDIANEIGCHYQSVYNFMRRYSIPIRNYSEAGKVMFEDPSKVKIFEERYEDLPLLTEENVWKWYWFNNPKWSIPDIAKKVKCSINTVNRFMVKQKIPIRDRCSANKERFNCPSKRVKYDLTRRSKDFKKKQSIITKKAMASSDVREKISKGRKIAWEDSLKRQNMLKGIKKRSESQMSKKQSRILITFYNRGPLFLSELVNMIDFKKYSKSALHASTVRLFRRNFLTRERKINKKSNRNNNLEYKYKVSEKAIQFLTLKEDPMGS
jgi:hypothetical protein